MKTDKDSLFLAIAIPDFEAQAAACWDPALWDQPYVITRQHTGHDRSTVIALSEYARMMGVHAGMKVQQVRRRYSGVKVIREDIACKEQARYELEAVCRDFTPVPDTRTYADVVLLDMSGSRQCYGPAYDRLGRLVQERLRERIGFRQVNIGSAGSVFTARLCALSAACGQVKKCEPGFESLVIADLSASLLPGFSEETRKRLANMNLKTIGDVQDLSPDFLRSRLGDEGERLYFMVRGVRLAEKKKSPAGIPAAELTFDVNTNDVKALQAVLHYLADRLSYLLRQARKKTGGISVTATYSDNRRGRQQHRFRVPTWECPDIYQSSRTLMDRLLTRRVAVKRLEVRADRVSVDYGQLDLFETIKEKKIKALARSLDQVRNKYGFNCINNASVTEYLNARPRH